MATSGIALGQVAFDGGDLLWAEGRPTERGRTCVVRRSGAGGEIADLLGPDANARTLVHEYGGGDYAASGGVLVWASFGDQRLWRLDPGAAEPVALTPEPATPMGTRFADLVISADRARLYAVRERHGAQAEPVNDLVTVPMAGGEPVAVAGGHDFFAAPRLSPDGATLAWLSWDHPRMPWDGCELWTAPVAADGTLGQATLVAGGPDEAIFQPAWSPDGVLHFVSDRSGWWNLYARADGGVRALCPLAAEFGAPQWVFGMSTYAFLDGGGIACIVGQQGIDHLGVLDGGRLELLELPYTAFLGPYLASDGRRVAAVASGPADPSAVVMIDLAGGAAKPAVEVVRRALSVEVDPAYVAAPEAIEFPAAGGSAHALYYPPTNPAASGPDGELPPLLVNSHGGPTGQTPAMFSLATTFWTSRGFGVVYVNYGGSTGYGRAYRKRLDGRWGIVDTDDCIAAARYLAERGSADPARLAIRGGSAGGYTTLCALTFHDDFAAGVSSFGVADPAALAAETHKFESRYLDGLIGPWPEAEAVYRERSPIHHTDGLSCPILLLQGLEDKVVPPSQAEAMAAALKAKGVPHALLAFAGEQHGFRQVATIKRVYEAELAFYGQVFGFTPAGELPPLELVR
jgi:dipeptidyl aminopeptidase/acylaminoacyl peptidase